jgi:hypothetical protein
MSRLAALLSLLTLRSAPWLGLGALLVLSACSHVHPYEREYLSRPNMTPADEAREAQFQAHLRESREGASAGSSAAGGGCGCN